MHKINNKEKVIRGLQMFTESVKNLTLSVSETEKLMNNLALTFKKHQNEKTRHPKHTWRTSKNDRKVPGRNITPVP